MSRVTRSATSRKDLYEIWLHIAADNFDAADELIDLIEEQIAQLSDFPGMGTRRDELRPGLRSLPVRKYLIFYTERSRGGMHLVRVMHGARNLRKIFKPPKG